MIKLNLKDAKGTNRPVNVVPAATGLELRKIAAEAYGLPDVGSVKLIFRGKLLADEKTLESYDIKTESIVMVHAVKKTPEQLKDDQDYQDHKAVVLSHPGRRPTGRTGLLA